MRKILVLLIAITAVVAVAFAYDWKTVYIANESLVVNDTLAKTWTGKTYPAKLFAASADSIAFYIESHDSIAMTVKLLTYTVTGALSDTITVGTKALGTTRMVVKKVESIVPMEIFAIKPLISITNSTAVKTKPINFKTVLIYKEAK